MKKQLFIIIVLLLCDSHVAQKNITHQQLSWLGYFQQIKINEKVSISSDVQERFFIIPLQQHQLLFRTGINYKFPQTNWTTQIGGCLFIQQPHDPEATIRLNVPELRPHVQFIQQTKLGSKTKFEHRYRIESRFFQRTNPDRTELMEGYEFRNFRVRYRFSYERTILPINKQASLGVKIYDEIHVNIGEKIVTNLFDQNRFYVGIQFQINEHLGMDLGYLNWFQQRDNGQFFNRNIIRMNVHHKIDFSGSQKS